MGVSKHTSRRACQLLCIGEGVAACSGLPQRRRVAHLRPHETDLRLGARAVRYDTAISSGETPRRHMLTCRVFMKTFCTSQALKSPFKTLLPYLASKWTPHARAALARRRLHRNVS